MGVIKCSFVSVIGLSSPGFVHVCLSIYVCVCVGVGGRVNVLGWGKSRVGAELKFVVSIKFIETSEPAILVHSNSQCFSFARDIWLVLCSLIFALTGVHLLTSCYYYYYYVVVSSCVKPCLIIHTSSSVYVPTTSIVDTQSCRNRTSVYYPHWKFRDAKWMVENIAFTDVRDSRESATYHKH